ncbi:GNAT family N-acetyltransferase [Streptomyces sp. NPDC001691]|uniref:GNAT family N-acetyltransferase n=1 Tax=unclassified Streptomyces TaxID=2593676 RepID=UPI001672B1B2|nr:GNAT family N-acetyltransferase [Streptomyces sp. SDr-06]
MDDPVPAAVRGVAVAGAVEADVAGILAVLAAAYAPYAGEFRPTALGRTAGSVRRELSHWLVARLDGRPVGCVLQYPEDGSYTLCFLATEPRLCGRGIGSALVDAVVRRAAAAGCREIRIALRTSLAANTAFFTRRGFRRVAPFRPGTHDLYELKLEAPPWAP